MLVKDLLNDRSKWIKGAFFNELGAHCLSGAINICYDIYSHKSVVVYNKLLGVIQETYGTQYYAVCQFNDEPSTTFEGIRRVLEIANI